MNSFQHRKKDRACFLLPLPRDQRWILGVLVMNVAGELVTGPRQMAGTKSWRYRTSECRWLVQEGHKRGKGEAKRET